MGSAPERNRDDRQTALLRRLDRLADELHGIREQSRIANLIALYTAADMSGLGNQAFEALVEFTPSRLGRTQASKSVADILGLERAPAVEAVEERPDDDDWGGDD